MALTLRMRCVRLGSVILTLPRRKPVSVYPYAPTLDGTLVKRSDIGRLDSRWWEGPIGSRHARANFDAATRAISGYEGTRFAAAGGPLAYLDQFIEDIRAYGRIVEPIQMDSRGDITNGHMRAFAAHALNMPLPWTGRPYPDYDTTSN